MSECKHTAAQMIGAIKQLEAGRTARHIRRERGVSKHTIFAWKAKYGGLDASQEKELKQFMTQAYAQRTRTIPTKFFSDTLPVCPGFLIMPFGVVALDAAD